MTVTANHSGIKQALQARAGLYHIECESVQTCRSLPDSTRVDYYAWQGESQNARIRPLASARITCLLIASLKASLFNGLMEALLGFTFDRPDGLVERGERMEPQHLAADALGYHSGEVWSQMAQSGFLN